MVNIGKQHVNVSVASRCYALVYVANSLIESSLQKDDGHVTDVFVVTEKARLPEKQSVVDEGSRTTGTSYDDDSALKSDKSIELLVLDGQQSRV